MGVDGSERGVAAVDSHADGTGCQPIHQKTHPLTEGEFHQSVTHKVVQQPETSCGKVVNMPDSPLFIADAPIKDPRQPNLHDLMVFGEVVHVSIRSCPLSDVVIMTLHSAQKCSGGSLRCCGGQDGFAIWLSTCTPTTLITLIVAHPNPLTASR